MERKAEVFISGSSGQEKGLSMASKLLVVIILTCHHELLTCILFIVGSESFKFFTGVLGWVASLD